MDSPLYTKFYFISYFKVILIVLLLPFATLSVLAQTNYIKMGDASPVSVKTGDYFYDSGGEWGDYSNGESEVLTLRSNAGTVIRITFEDFEVEDRERRRGKWVYYDFMRIYDGPNTSSTSIGRYFGTSGGSNTNRPTVITSTSNSMTFRFKSDESVLESGWKARIEVINLGEVYCVSYG